MAVADPRVIVLGGGLMASGRLGQFTAAFLATGVAFGVGHLIGGVVS